MEDSFTAFHERSKTSVHFKSKTDALVAQFAFKFASTPDATNSLLAIVRDPSFDPSELTFENAMDIELQIAWQRQKGIQTISFNDVGRGDPDTLAGIPLVVFDLVMEELKTQLGPFALDANTLRNRSPYEHSTTFNRKLEVFKQMSLVHRSWTCLAQQALRHRVTIVGEYELGASLKSSHSIGNIVELVLYLDALDSWQGTRMLADLVGCLFSRQRNLRRIYLRTMTEGNDPVYRMCILHLQELTSLECLWINGRWAHQNEDYYQNLRRNTLTGPRCLEDICVVLPKLSSLRSLWIKDVYHRTEEPDSTTGVPCPSHRLKTVAFDWCKPEYLVRDPGEEDVWPEADESEITAEKAAMNLRTLSIITSQQNDFPLETLVLPIYWTPTFDHEHYFTAFQEILPSLRTLIIVQDESPLSSFKRSCESANFDILPHATSLHRLCLCAPLVLRWHLPQSLEYLHFHMTDAKFFRKHDGSSADNLITEMLLPESLSGASRPLRELRISFQVPQDLNVYPPKGRKHFKLKHSLLTKTKSACEARGIRFVIESDMYWNHADFVSSRPEFLN